MKNAWVSVIAVALVFYGNGAAFIESFVNYPSWPLVGESEFTRFINFSLLQLDGMGCHSTAGHRLGVYRNDPGSNSDSA